MTSIIPRLMLIAAQDRSHLRLPELAARALAGGVDTVQLREPVMSHEARRAAALAFIDRTVAPDQLIVNDDLPLAAELGCGLHLPERSEQLTWARARLGASRIIGRSVHSPESAAASAGADYLIAGHVFATASKPGLLPIGVDGLAAIVAASTVPVLAIGGITVERIPAVIAAGASGIVVVSAITDSPDSQAAAAALRDRLELSSKEHSLVCASESVASIVTLIVNGKSMSVPAGSSIAELLRQRQLDQRLVAVEHNQAIVAPARFPSTLLNTGDEVEIVQFVGGG